MATSIAISPCEVSGYPLPPSDIPPADTATAPSAEVYHGVPLADLLARVHSMAHRFYRQHGKWEPLEEYLSAGHGAIAECIQRYNPDIAPPGGFKSYCLFQVEMAMRDVRVRAAGSHNMRKRVTGTQREPKYTVEGWDHDQLYALRSAPATQETLTYLHEIVGFLASLGTPSTMLFETVDGADYAEVAASWHCSEANVGWCLAKVRQRLRQWASWCALPLLEAL